MYEKYLVIFLNMIKVKLRKDKTRGKRNPNHRAVEGIVIGPKGDPLTLFEIFIR